MLNLRRRVKALEKRVAALESQKQAPLDMKVGGASVSIEEIKKDVIQSVVQCLKEAGPPILRI